MSELANSGRLDGPESNGAAYARGFKVGWAKAMQHMRDEATRQMYEPPRPEPSIPPTREELFTDG